MKSLCGAGSFWRGHAGARAMDEHTGQNCNLARSVLKNGRFGIEFQICQSAGGRP